jgi:hypothetical protein
MADGKRTRPKVEKTSGQDVENLDTLELTEEAQETGETYNTPQTITLSEEYYFQGTKSNVLTMNVPRVKHRTLAKRKLLRERGKDKNGNTNYDDEDLLKVMAADLCGVPIAEFEELSYGDFNKVMEVFTNFIS